MWIARQLRLLRASPAPAVLEGGPEWGTHFIVAALRSEGTPLVWLDLDAVDGGDPITLGNKLANGLLEATGSSVFGYGLPIDYGLARLERDLPLLGPLVIALTGAEHAPSLTARLLRSDSPHLKVIVAAPDGSIAGHPATPACTSATRSDGVNPTRSAGVNLAEPNSANPAGLAGLNRITPRDLRLTLREARHLAGPELDPALVERLLTSTGGVYEPYRAAVAAELGVPPPARPQPRAPLPDASGQRNPDELLDRLIRRGKWRSALEFAVANRPARIADFVTEAGNHFLGHGRAAAFWRLLHRIPEPQLHDEPILVWMLLTSLEHGEQERVIPLVEAHLDHAEAPELRATNALVGRPADPFGEAERAYLASRTPTTVASYALLLCRNGDPEAATPLLEEALGEHERAGRHYQALWIAVGMAENLIAKGDYTDAAHWAAWAVSEHHTHGLSSTVLRHVLHHLHARALLLAQGSREARTALEALPHARDPNAGSSLARYPYLEAAAAAPGDLALAENDPHRALCHYRAVYDAYPTHAKPSGVNGVVNALIRIGMRKSAAQEARRCLTLTRRAGLRQHALARLAVGTATATLDPAAALPDLRDSLAHFERHRNAPLLARAALQLGHALLATGQPEEARLALERADAGLRELSEAGWRLLAGDDEPARHLRQLWRGEESELALTFLGNRTAKHGRTNRRLPLRWCETLFILTRHPDGISSEELATLLYGETGSVGNVRSILSRLRRVLPISSKPYRLDLHVAADYLDLERALREGEHELALALYRGPLLPDSDSPYILEARHEIEEALRQAILSTTDSGLLLELAERLEDDLELWEAALRHLPRDDPAQPLVLARVKRLRALWMV